MDNRFIISSKNKYCAGIFSSVQPVNHIFMWGIFNEKYDCICNLGAYIPITLRKILILTLICHGVHQ